MRQFITLLGGAMLTLAATGPVAAQEERKERHAVWIGAMCVPVDPAVQAQLQLDDGVGLVVAEIVPESPADQAGLQRFDVVAGLDGQPLRHVGQLMDAVDAAADKSLKLDIVRGGKSQTVEVRPTERPRGDVLRRFDLPPNEGRNPPQTPEQFREWVEGMRQNLPEGEAKRIQEWMDRMQRGEAMPLRMHVFGPGVVMHQTVGEPLPKGVTVTIKKAGDKPTEIHVERGDEKWDVKENELDKLPAELRGPVGAMLAGGPQSLHGVVTGLNNGDGGGIVVGSGNAGINVEGEPKVRVQSRTFALPSPSAKGKTDTGTGDFEALKKQVEQLQRQVDELQQSLRAAPAKEPATKRKVES